MQKARTTITLSKQALRRADALAKVFGSRSAVFERALEAFDAEEARLAREARDLQTMNNHADELNAEARDALKYQYRPKK